MENTEKSAAPTGGGGAKEKIEKQARQLAYDVRYKVRQSLKAQSGGKSDPATVRKAYATQLGKSPANPAVKTRAKQMLMGEDYINLDKVVAQGVASAMYKVFVEHHQKDADGNTIPHEEEIQEDKPKEKTYKVRVTDKETGNSYVRNATRAKIAELRNNPNISSVEMTEYGEVTKSEKHKGKQTASVKSGKGVDYDGDGKVESGSKEHAGVVHNAIQKKKGGKQDGKDTRKENYTWKEAFSGLIEKKSEEEEKKITGKGVNNKNLIKVFPDEVKEDAEYGYDKEGNSLNPKDIKKKNEKDPNGKAKKEEEEDYRSMGTKANLVKNKLRSMGLNMSQKPEGELVEQGIEDILARLEKKRISKGGNPDDSPLGKKTGRAMKAQQDKVRKKAGVKTEEIELDEAERKLADRLHRKRKLYDRTTKKAMDYARREGEAAGHARYRMGQLDDEMDKVKDKMKKEEVETLDELKTSTLRSYANKASVEAVGRGVDAGIKGMTGPKKDMEKNMTKAYKRQRGINRAVNKLASRAERNEEYDNTKSPDYEKKKKALAKKHGGADKVKGHPQYESVASAVDALNSYFNKNQNLHGSVITKKN